MNNIKIKKEEFDTNRNEIAKAESLWDINFPKDYVEFLLQNNGAVVYPNWPNLGPENKTEVWGIERFYSIGDVIIQKLYPMSYTLHDIHEEDFGKHNLNPDKILVFAQGERGVYFLNLAKEEYGQIYIANFSGGDGISKTSANSFSKFINSLDKSEWDEDFNQNFEFSNEYHSGIKIMQWHLFYTPKNPELGFQRFKEVFEYFENSTLTKEGFSNIIYKYVDERLKLNYLLQKGLSTHNLLRGAKKAETIQYLVNEINLDINVSDNGRFPLQNYLTPGSKYDAKNKYELIHKLMEMGIEMDWSINGKLYNGEEDLPMIDKLKILHGKYKDLEKEEKEFRQKYRRPSGMPPYIKSKLIEEKLGIIQEENWINKLLNKITRGNKG